MWLIGVIPAIFILYAGIGVLRAVYPLARKRGYGKPLALARAIFAMVLMYLSILTWGFGFYWIPKHCGTLLTILILVTGTAVLIFLLLRVMMIEIKIRSR